MPHPSVLLTDLNEDILGVIFSDYLDFKSLVNFAVVLVSSPHSSLRRLKYVARGAKKNEDATNQASFVFPRLSLHRITLGAEAQKVTQSSLSLIRRSFLVKGLCFNMKCRYLSKRRASHIKRSISFSMEEMTNTDMLRKVLIRRMPFIIAAFDEVESLIFDLEDDDVDIAHLGAIFKNLANVLQAGFCARVDDIQVPGIRRVVGGQGNLRAVNPNIVRMLINAGTDEILPQANHPLSGGFIESEAPRGVRLPTDQERHLHGAIELLYYLLPNSKARTDFARQLLADT